MLEAQGEPERSSACNRANPGRKERRGFQPVGRNSARIVGLLASIPSHLSGCQRLSSAGRRWGAARATPPSRAAAAGAPRARRPRATASPPATASPAGRAAPHPDREVEVRGGRRLGRVRFEHERVHDRVDVNLARLQRLRDLPRLQAHRSPSDRGRRIHSPVPLDRTGARRTTAATRAPKALTS